MTDQEKLRDEAAEEYVQALDMALCVFDAGFIAHQKDMFRENFISGFDKAVEIKQGEIDRLKKIIAKELSENDELGSEYTYVCVLKAEIEELKGALELETDDYVKSVGRWKIIQRLEEQVKESEATQEKLVSALKAYKKRCWLAPSDAISPNDTFLWLDRLIHSTETTKGEKE